MLSRSMRALHHASRFARTPICILSVCLLPQAVRAGDTDIALPLYGIPAAHSAAPSDPAFDPAAAGRAQINANRPPIQLSRSSNPFAMVELPPDTALPGSGYKRPHHALGYRWQAAESWLRDHGFDAHTCYLPMMRMHTKLAASGVSGTLWVYGRCTFR